MKSIAQYEARMPVWALCSLINGDDSGLDNDDDLQAIDAWHADMMSNVDSLSASHYTIDISEEESYLAPYNCLNSLGDDVVDITVYIFK